MSSSCLPKCSCNGPSIWDTLKPQQRAGEAQVELRDAASFPAWVHQGAQDPTNLLSLWAWIHVVVVGPMETRSCLLGVNEFGWETGGTQNVSLHPFFAISQVLIPSSLFCPQRCS